jgi:hypothetical protein
MKWKITKPSDWLGIAMIVFFALAFVKCSVQEISLLTHWEYGIAQVTKVYRRAKGEMHITYWYDVAGVRYERGNIWDGKVQPGERYVVRYGAFDPSGNQSSVTYPYQIVSPSPMDASGKASCATLTITLPISAIIRLWNSPAQLQYYFRHNSKSNQNL